MFLGLQFLGWVLLIGAYVPAALLLAWMWRRFGPRSKTFIATALLTLIPFIAAVAEAAYVEYNWRKLCATAKTEVKRNVVVEGFYDDGFRNAGWKVLQGGKNGFRFVEWKDKQNRIWRTERFNDPELRTVQIEKPTARYHWQAPRFATPAGHLLTVADERIVDTQSGEIVARHVTAGRYPAFVDRLWRQWFDNVPQVCGTGRSIWGETLIGIDRKE